MPHHTIVVRDTVPLAHTPDGCAAAHVVITGTTVTAAFSDRGSCGAGVVLHSLADATVERTATHWRLALRVAWLNQTDAPITGARKLYLAPDSGLVLLPIARYGVDPTPVNADGVLGKATYWELGGVPIAAGGIGPEKLLLFDIPVGTQQLMLRMTGDGLAPTVGRPPLVPGWWAPTDSMLAVVNTDAEGGVKVYLNFLAVRFSSTTTAEQVRAALRSQDAVIVGGRSGGLLGAPSYLVQIPMPGSFEALKAVVVALAREPGVSRVGMQYSGSTMAPRSRAAPPLYRERVP